MKPKKKLPPLRAFGIPHRDAETQTENKTKTKNTQTKIQTARTACQTEPLSFIHESTQTLRPKHRSTQVQTKRNETRGTQTTTDVNRPDRFNNEKIRTVDQISKFEVWYFGEFTLN